MYAHLLVPIYLQASMRTRISQALREAAASVQAEDALPPEGADIGAYVLGPRNGEWVRWEAALGDLAGQAHSTLQPPPDAFDSRCGRPRVCVGVGEGAAAHPRFVRVCGCGCVGVW